MTTAVAQTTGDQQNKAPVFAGERGLQLTSLDDFWRWANFVIASGLAPKGMQTPESIVVATQMGMELGLAPMQAIQNIAVINGRPSVWGDSVKGIILATKLCEVFSEQMVGTPYKDDYHAVCRVKRAGFDEVVSKFSVAQAKLAKLWGKQGPWTEYPDRMLQMRARSFACRDAFPDALRGLLTSQEVEDMPRELPAGDYSVVDEAPEPKPETKSRAQRIVQKAIPAAAQQVSEPEPEPIQQEAEPTPEPEYIPDSDGVLPEEADSVGQMSREELIAEIAGLIGDLVGHYGSDKIKQTIDAVNPGQPGYARWKDTGLLRVLFSRFTDMESAKSAG